MIGNKCKIETCNNILTYGRELVCGSCKMKKWRHGSYDYRPATIEDKFWINVRKSESCWIWTGHVMKNGYGTITVKRAPFGAHRFSYELHYGKIKNGLSVLHKCDVRNCVNPEHLFIGTQQDNMTDMINKRRHRTNPSIGEKSGRAKLKESDVIEIKRLIKLNLSMSSIANKYGVSPRAIRSIKDNENWKHIKDF
jgi:hypothetical protein